MSETCAVSSRNSRKVVWRRRGVEKNGREEKEE